MSNTTSRRILVIEKDRNIGELMKFFLYRQRGDVVTTVCSGREALAIAETDPPDLIMLDLMLTDMNSDEVYQHLRAIPALQEVPVLFHECFRPEEVYPRARRLGAAGYLCLPFDPEEITAARDAALKGETYYP